MHNSDYCQIYFCFHDGEVMMISLLMYAFTKSSTFCLLSFLTLAAATAFMDMKNAAPDLSVFTNDDLVPTPPFFISVRSCLDWTNRVWFNEVITNVVTPLIAVVRVCQASCWNVFVIQAPVLEFVSSAAQVTWCSILSNRWYQLCDTRYPTLSTKQVRKHTYLYPHCSVFHFLVLFPQLTHH